FAYPPYGYRGALRRADKGEARIRRNPTIRTHRNSRWADRSDAPESKAHPPQPNQNATPHLAKQKFPSILT
ncbi:hypothetical protein, partial [Marinimicrobium sp.]|uniref:hypothetical protein n=1 Tax=Marinimicrobium sp. TaxID=2024837 RepID=UPI00258098A6